MNWTNYLDIVSIRWLTQFLKAGWKGEMVLITHDRDFMNSVTTHTMAIHRGVMRRQDRGDDPQAIRADHRGRGGLDDTDRVNEEKKRKEIELFINCFRAPCHAGEVRRPVVRQFQKKERMEKLATLENPRSFLLQCRPVPRQMAPRVRTMWVFPTTRRGRSSLCDLTIAVEKRDRIGIIGKNGKGKTTLLNILAGEFTPRSGTITYSQNLKIGYFGQMNIDRLDPEVNYRGRDMERGTRPGQDGRQGYLRRHAL